MNNVKHVIRTVRINLYFRIPLLFYFLFQFKSILTVSMRTHIGLNLKIKVQVTFFISLVNKLDFYKLYGVTNV